MPDDLPAAGHGMHWTSVTDMQANTWVEIPTDDHSPPRWTRLVTVKPPSWTGERRWALCVDDGEHELWIKAGPDLVFRTADSDMPPG